MYPTTGELVAASSVPELVNLTADQQDSLRSAAIVGIESYTQQTFEPFDGSKQVRTYGGNEVMLPARMERIDSIAQNDVPFEDMTAVELSDDGGTIFLGRPVPNYYEQALMEISDGAYPRAFGDGWLTITGLWNWTDAPREIPLALRYDMEDTALAESSALTASVHMARKLGLKEIVQGNLRASLGGAPTLTPRVQALLAPYVWNGGVGRLA